MRTDVSEGSYQFHVQGRKSAEQQSSLHQVATRRYIPEDGNIQVSVQCTILISSQLQYSMLVLHDWIGYKKWNIVRANYKWSTSSQSQ
jgi:hypothetical protein